MKHLYFFFLLALSFSLSAQEIRPDSAVADSILLNEVLIKADKRWVSLKADRYVVDALAIRNGKNNLSDLLRDIPGIIQNKNNVSIFGKGGVKIMINGRLKQIPDNQIANLLRSYSASDVKNVEVIYHTGAEFDASGNYGIINFIMDKPKEDFIGGNVSNDLTISDYASNESVLNLKYNRKKFTSIFSMGYTYGKEYGWNTSDYFYTDLKRNSLTRSWNWHREWNGHLEIDYALDKKSTISMDASFSNDRKRDNGSDHIQTIYASVPTENQHSHFYRKQPQRYWNASLYVDRKWNDNISSNLILDYYNQKENTDYSFTSDLHDEADLLVEADNYHFLNQEWRHLKGFSFAFDQTWKIPSNYTLKLGTKGSFSTIGNDSSYDYSNMDTQDNHFDYDENCIAAYLVLTHSFFGCLDTRLGGRYEYTFTKGVSDFTETKKNDYGHLFPDIQLSYRLANNNQLQLTYVGAIIRPWMSYLNPFRLYSSPFIAKEGTSTLSPSFFNKVELAYQKSFLKGFFKIYSAYSTSNNQIAEVLRMTSDGISLYKWENAYKQNDWRVGYMLNMGLFNWLRTSLSGSFQHTNPQTIIVGFDENIRKNVQYTQLMQLSFIFDKQQHFTGSLMGSVSTPRRTPFEKYSTTGWLRGGLNYTCLKDKLNLGLYVYNIIPISPSGKYYSNNNMTTLYKDHTFRTSVCLSISYTFGQDIREIMKTHSSSEVTGRFNNP